MYCEYSLLAVFLEKTKGNQTIMRLFITAFLWINLVTLTQGQVKKILHQSVELETFNKVTLDLVGEYEIVEWAGNSILVETNIELYSASRNVYNSFKDAGRYDIKADTLDQLVHLESVDKERRPIKYKGNECFEIVRVRILIPEDFEIIDQKNLARKEPILADDSDQ